MKKFIIKSILFVLPLIFMAVFIEIKLENRTTIYSTQKASFESRLSQIKILILGSSHSFEGINPEFLPYKGYNLAGSGQDFYIDYHLLSKYINRLPVLKTVIIPISYHSFFNSLEFSSDSDNRIDFYKKAYGISRYKNSVGILTQSEIFSYGVKRAIYFAFFENHGNKYNLIYGHNARTRNNYSIENTINPVLVKDNINAYHKIMSLDLLEWNKSWLTKTIELLDKRGVKPILITLPVYKTFLNNMDTNYYQVMQESVSAYCRKYGLIYLNYINSPFFDKNDFTNSNHLSNSGAIKFTQLLSDKLVNLH